MQHRETLNTERRRKETDMTTAIAARSDAGLLAGIEPNAGILAGFRRAWAQRQAYRSTLSELKGLTDRELSDTGILRGALKETARRAVYGE